MHLYVGRSTLQVWVGTTAYLGPRGVAERACWVHSDYVLLCGCSSEGLGSGAEAVLFLCPLPPLLFCRALMLHLGLALWSHGSSGAQRGPSVFRASVSHLTGTAPTCPTLGLPFGDTLTPLPPSASISSLPNPDQNQLSAPVPSPFPHSQGPGQDPVQSALGARKNGSLSSLAIQCPDEAGKVKRHSLSASGLLLPLGTACSSPVSADSDGPGMVAGLSHPNYGGEWAAAPKGHTPGARSVPLELRTQRPRNPSQGVQISGVPVRV